MKITRDVVYDLLPAYFAGELSADSRALIEEFFASDPEFGRMAERFRTLMEERSRPGVAATAAEQERTSFDRVRKRANLRFFALVWGLAALWSFGIAALPNSRFGFGLRNPGVILSIFFGAVTVVCWFASYFYATRGSAARRS
jgi:anti-sigma factor RsiW